MLQKEAKMMHLEKLIAEREGLTAHANAIKVRF